MSEPAISPDLIDADAQKVIRRLVRNGYEAFLVGGCVRDLLLARTPKDFDLATSATPSEVRDLFRNCRIIGRRFRLAHVFFGDKIIETATFRANPREVLGEEAAAEEEELLIHRDNVFGTAEEDARRRDFTINGLFYDLGPGQVIDYVGGLKDLTGRSIRTIGDPDIRFREDPVRILRALKFAARLGFDIEDATYKAVITHREEIQKSAPPRVLEEIYRLLRGGASLESVLLLRETGLLGLLVPDVEKRLDRDPVALDPYLRVIDQALARGEALSNSLLLVFLVAPDLAPLFDEKGGERLRAPEALIDGALGPLIERMRVTRRDAERAKLLLLGQRRVWQLRRKPGGRPAGLLGRDWFQDAIQAHGLYRLAQGVPPEEALGELSALRQDVPRPVRRGPRPGPGDGEPVTVEQALDDGEGRRPQAGGGDDDEGRRRRRRRGRRRPPGGPAAGQEGQGAGEDEPVENEDAALDAYTAALSALRYDD